MNRFIDMVLVSGSDYGIIPHCSKPSLLKPGAEKILNYLGLIARTEVVNRVEDYNVGGKNPEDLKPKTSSTKSATQKQIAFLEKLMQESNSSPEAMNRYVKKVYNIEDYQKASALIVSELIEKFQAAKQQ